MFPNNESQWRQLCGLHRAAYNLAIAAIRSGKPNRSILRTEIREQLRSIWAEFDGVFISVVSDEAVNQAFDTFRKCLAKWKRGEKAVLRFCCKRDSRQGFIVQRCAIGGQIFPRALGKTHITEELNNDVTNQTVRVIHERGRYYIAFHQILTLSENQAGDVIASIDPGVRTFATAFGPDYVVKYGENLQDAINRFQSRIDKLNSERSKLLNLKSDAQWICDRLRNLQKKLWRLSNRISDLVDDLHRRVIHDLVSTADIILLPHFRTSQMSRRGKRKIGRGTTRQMLSMRFYQFSQRLEWACRRYGKTLIRVNEAYTSKTDSRTGQVKQVGGDKSINGLDRDTNGARGILLRALTRQLAPESQVIANPSL